MNINENNLTDEQKKRIKAFSYYGFDDKEINGNQVSGCCIFCDKEDKFYINIDNGLWDCKVCGESGNITTWLKRVITHYKAYTKNSDYRRLSRCRKISAKILKDAGLVFHQNEAYSSKSNPKGKWLMPVYNSKGSVIDIRNYYAENEWAGNKKSLPKGLRGTPSCNVGLYGLEELVDKSKSNCTVLLCEGEWDRLKMLQVIYEAGLHKKYIAVAVPGANTFKWDDYFKNRDVYVLYDNDKAGRSGTQKVFSRLCGVANSLMFLHWDSKYKDGYDVRDYFNDKGCTEGALNRLISYCQQTPDGMTKEEADEVLQQSDIGKYKKPLKQDATFDWVVNTFIESGLKMNTDLITFLKIGLGVVMQGGSKDPVWIFVVGEPSSGKTQILKAFSKCHKAVFKSTLKAAGLISGFRMADGDDPSLIPQLNNKTLVCKDFTEILEMHPMEKDEIFSTLRGAYDGEAERTYGNGISRVYKDTWFNIIAGVTGAIDADGKAQMGERFLKVRLKSLQDDDRLTHTLDILTMLEYGNVPEDADDLRCWAVNSFIANELPKATIPKAMLSNIVKLAEIVAYMRTQVSKNNKDFITYIPAPELSIRLAKQLINICKISAGVDGRNKCNNSDYNITKKIAISTAEGFHIKIFKTMMELGGRFTIKSLEQLLPIKITNEQLRSIINDMITIGIVYKTEESEYNLAVDRKLAVYKVKDQLKQYWIDLFGATALSADTELVKPPKQLKRKKNGISQIWMESVEVINLSENFTKRYAAPKAT